MECKPWSNENWDSIEVYPYDVVYNAYHKPMFHRCHWCGGDAIAVVSRISKFSGHKYEDFACERHGQGWMPDATQQEG